MKRLMLLLLIGTFFVNLAKADFGSCVVYEAKFYLKDGRVFKGAVECSGDGDMTYLGEDGYNEYCSDQGMMNLLKQIQANGHFWNWEDGGIQSPDDFGKIIVYKNLEDIIVKGMPHTRRPYGNHLEYGFTSPDDIVFIDTSDIEKLVFWDAHYSTRNWVTSEIVIGTKDMINTIQNQQYWNRLTVDLDTYGDSLVYTEDWPMWGVELINYNENNNVAELKRLAELKLKELTNWKVLEAKVIEKYGIDNSGEDHHMINRIVEEGRERYFQELREWFWKRGILIVEIYGTC